MSGAGVGTPQPPPRPGQQEVTAWAASAPLAPRPPSPPRPTGAVIHAGGGPGSGAAGRGRGGGCASGPAWRTLTLPAQDPLSHRARGGLKPALGRTALRWDLNRRRPGGTERKLGPGLRMNRGLGAA